MSKQNRKGATVSTRNGYPIAESMGDDSIMRLIASSMIAQSRMIRNAAVMRGMHR